MGANGTSGKAIKTSNIEGIHSTCHHRSTGPGCENRLGKGRRKHRIPHSRNRWRGVPAPTPALGPLLHRRAAGPDVTAGS
jgi:hypothetical protein